MKHQGLKSKIMAGVIISITLSGAAVFPEQTLSVLEAVKQSFFGDKQAIEVSVPQPDQQGPSTVVPQVQHSVHQDQVFDSMSLPKAKSDYPNQWSEQTQAMPLPRSKPHLNPSSQQGKQQNRVYREAAYGSQEEVNAVLRNLENVHKTVNNDLDTYVQHASAQHWSDISALRKSFNDHAQLCMQTIQKEGLQPLNISQNAFYANLKLERYEMNARYMNSCGTAMKDAMHMIKNKMGR